MDNSQLDSSLLNYLLLRCDVDKLRSVLFRGNVITCEHIQKATKVCKTGPVIRTPSDASFVLRKLYEARVIKEIGVSMSRDQRFFLGRELTKYIETKNNLEGCFEMFSFEVLVDFDL